MLKTTHQLRRFMAATVIALGAIGLLAFSAHGHAAPPTYTLGYVTDVSRATATITIDGNPFQVSHRTTLEGSTHHISGAAALDQLPRGTLILYSAERDQLRSIQIKNPEDVDLPNQSAPRRTP
ncbi:hypothetical protein TVD_01425 [Thioalkalivibrio versutus]|uniref:DUF5666 domain-containing protein n=1 Tax=Thioalkalivibrio versutus TaxID=106634 RepID=A0A0G3G3R2_9GAMM|nr:hypothetical protein [Thioalkalivibrio versutus]AKJ94112.1 hypothetical protein TVD_01425 [Thioalkalivibrio versutus]